MGLQLADMRVRPRAGSTKLLMILINYFWLRGHALDTVSQERRCSTSALSLQHYGLNRKCYLPSGSRNAARVRIHRINSDGIHKTDLPAF